MNKKHEAVLDLVRDGYNRQQIADRLDMTINAVAAIKSKLRRNGHTFVGERNARRPLERQPVVPIGKLRQTAVANLSDDAQEWLLKQIPPGSTLSEFAVACIQDAYNEESDDADL